MITFKLRIFDEKLLNGDDLRAFLNENTGLVYISADAEGPSLEFCGVLEILDNHCRESGRDQSTIKIITANTIERYPYEKIGPGHSHWWGNSLISYNRTEIEPVDLAHKRFAYMIGRKNPERLVMMYWLRSKDCLLSSMFDFNFRPELIDLEPVQLWIDDYQSFCQWVHDIEIKSLDGYTVDDQYKAVDPSDPSWGETHMSLLNFYHNFDIEIVAETWTRGQTFFPTEKTVRPLLSTKPIISYAAKNWMANLRDMGFKTWSDCWNESYDRYEGIERWQHIQNLVCHLEDMPNDEFDEILARAKSIAEYNQQHAQRIGRP